MFKRFRKNKNYKLLIGLIVGFIVSSSVVYAVYYELASETSYDNSNTWLESTTVQDALDELAYHKDCPLGNECLIKKTTLAVGDYVSYTPSKTSYTTDTSKTGYSSTQTINPSELNLWRVFSVNQDGTADIVSVNVSSVDIYFEGLTGYLNYIGYLNVLASQYETSGITVGSRHYGYTDQTEYITNTAYFTYPCPWSCQTGSTCTPDPDDNEMYGGGNICNNSFFTTVLGPPAAAKINGKTSDYWHSCRYYTVSSSSCDWDVLYVAKDNEGYGTARSSYFYRYSSNGTASSGSKAAAIRPFVTLSANLSYAGVGNLEHPMIIQ